MIVDRDTFLEKTRQLALLSAECDHTCDRCPLGIKNPEARGSITSACDEYDCLELVIVHAYYKSNGYREMI
jgi:hypothetical protein